MQLATIPTFPLVVTIAVSVAALVVFVVYCFPSVFVRVERGTNDSESAKANFLRVLRATENDLTIYDDGDASDCSLYQDRKVVDEVLGFLQEHPKVKVRCLFTCDEDLLLTRTLTSSGFDFDVRITGKPRDDNHFKIADSGNMMYLTRHQKGACERDYRLLDCTSVPKLLWRISRVTNKAYLKPFNRVFAKGYLPTVSVTT